MKLKSWLEELPYTLLQGSLETEVDEVVYDSRKAAPGTVFVCMRGANVDSHTFIPDVVEKGAPVLVVEHPVEAPENVTVIQVENGRNALSLLSAARFDYPARKMTAIGVTGTKGKTTTTYMIKAILEANSARPVPAWLDVNRDTTEAKVVALPNREDIDLPVEETLIVELYSK